jgi:hypothetical protein
MAGNVSIRDRAGVPAQADGLVRHLLAIIVLVICTGGMLGLAFFCVYLAEAGEKRADEVRFVFSTILPLLASWVGTVLAYYYSRENLAAATRSVTDLAMEITGTQRLQSTLASQAMIPLARIATLIPKPVATYAQLSALKLTEVLKFLDDRGVQRLPILNDNNVLQYLVHKSAITNYRSKYAGTQGINDKTLQDLIDEDAAGPKMFKTSYVFVSLDSTLADAKAAMDRLAGCEDVFATRNGKSDEPVEGWITDNDIAKAAKV